MWYTHMSQAHSQWYTEFGKMRRKMTAMIVKQFITQEDKYLVRVFWSVSAT